MTIGATDAPSGFQSTRAPGFSPAAFLELLSVIRLLLALILQLELVYAAAHPHRHHASVQHCFLQALWPLLLVEPPFPLPRDVVPLLWMFVRAAFVRFKFSSRQHHGN